jgi:hypothetical protein
MKHRARTIVAVLSPGVYFTYELTLASLLEALARAEGDSRIFAGFRAMQQTVYAEKR